MRALLAAVVAVAIVVFTAAPHVHADAQGGEQGCQVCVMRHAGALAERSATLAPPATWVEATVLEPVTVPAVGAPQGAVPGQSPPAGA